MIQFADEAVITVRSGKGGNGCVSFRREKYIPNGGPNGGDGGRGGNVVFCLKQNLRTLSHLRHHPIFKAGNGGDGQGWGRHGKNGSDVVIPLPPGSVLRDADTGEVIRDFSLDFSLDLSREKSLEDTDDTFLFLKGGNGGWGNTHFKSSTNQAPRTANLGAPGQEKRLKVELSLMADVGLVGFPNAGKSSLLDTFTNARAKVAPYPFTTKIPNLGVLREGDRDIIIADIPGIIEGASGGAGLGIRFLKHVSRTKALLFMIDAADSEGDKCFHAYELLLGELGSFSEELLSKPRIVLCNKIDLPGAVANAQKIKEQIQNAEPSTKVVAVSIANKTNIGEVRAAIVSLVQQSEAHRSAGKARPTLQQSAFLAGRSVDLSMQTQFPGEAQYPVSLR